MFLSHKSSATPNSYQVLNQFNREKVLVNSNGAQLVSNICPHQQSLISTTNGTGSRVCPYHNWSFTLEGQPITSGRTESYCKNSKPLESNEVYEWNSLLFTTPMDFTITHKFNNMILMENRIDIVKTDYKTVMDIFLDVDHIQTVHTGIYDMIGITNTNVKWDFYKNGNVQTVAQGAEWIALYPYTMIEWQQGSLFITVALPNGDTSNVHVFKYMDSNNSDMWKLNELVWETAWAQDKKQAELITKFPEDNLESQKIHYRDFLRLNGTY
jgi:phenylpropionate dioxygenase-like ring-hydroxylating dioxygenase large terminal subunit